MKDMTVDPRSISDPVEARGELRRALATISGKWKLEILWLLNQRVHRFGELKRAIPGITQPMLTSQLRELEDDGLVIRTISQRYRLGWTTRLPTRQRSYVRL